MKNKIINSQVLILFIISILIVLSIPMAAFADDEDQTKEEIPNASSLEGFWLRYNPEEIEYHVAEPMEKICVIGSEEPLEIQIVKEENDGPLIEHFLGLTLTHIYTSFEDLTSLFYEEEAAPDYEITEENGILKFTVSKDGLKCPDDLRSYELLFAFDDGKACSLVWVTKEIDLLGYTDDGHVWIVKEPPTLNWDENPVERSNLIEESTIEGGDTLLVEEKNDDVSERNVKVILILSLLIIAVAVVYILYRLKNGKKR